MAELAEMEVASRESTNGFQEKAAVGEPAPIRLNLGGGVHEIPGYENIDRIHGKEAYPLTDYATGSVEEIRASHVLEHFSHRESQAVVREWARVLKPGGRMRLAVPDFDWIARAHLGGSSEPYFAYLMGSHMDANDFHKAVFNKRTLLALMRQAGLCRIHKWESDLPDCSRLPVSLNLEGFKPQLLNGKRQLPKIHVIVSMPRLAFTENMFCSLGTCGALGIPFHKVTGAYWEQCLEREITSLVRERSDIEYILTMDYDSVFRAEHILDLCDLAIANPEADAIAPIQVHRGGGQFMVSLLREDGTFYSEELPLSKKYFKKDLTRAHTAHFGLTLFKANKLRKLPHPWFLAKPNEQGEWQEGRKDADISFWDQWRDQGNTLYLANRVCIGHAQLMISWPSEEGNSTHQSTQDFWDGKEPDELWS